jgi:hypothetical protein
MTSTTSTSHEPAALRSQGANAPRSRSVTRRRAILGRSASANPNYVKLTDENGKPKPWHHTLRKEKDGTLTPSVPLGIAAGADGSVYVRTLAPFTVIRYSAAQLK